MSVPVLPAANRELTVEEIDKFLKDIVDHFKPGQRQLTIDRCDAWLDLRNKVVKEK